MLVGDLPRLNAEKYPAKIALIDGEARLTWSQAEEQTNRWANALHRLGVRRGERLAVMTANRHEWLICVFGAAKTGVAVVPVGNYCDSDEIKFVLEEAQCRVVVADEASLSRAGAAADRVPHVRHRIVFGDGSGHPGWLGYSALLAAESAREHAGRARIDDEMIILYTSGSTGRPKGIVLAHRQILAMAGSCATAFGVKHSDVAIVCVPVNHKGPFNKFKTHALVGGTVVILDGFNGPDFLRTIEREKVTNISAFPSMFQDMFRLPDFGEYDLSSLKRIMITGTVMTRGTFEEAMARFPGVAFQHAYGLTDAGGLMTMHSSKERPDKLGSVGRSLPGKQVEIHDEQDRQVPSGTVGEIVCRADSMMNGYLNQPELTQEVIRAGWLHTGDLGKYDADGYLWLVGRLKDMIKTGGLNVAPIEVENALSQHPAVLRVAVFGVTDERWGEAVSAAVVTRTGHPVTEHELIEYCGSRLAHFKKPKNVFFVDALPENSLGTKILKDVLKARFSGASGTARSGTA